MQTAIQRFRSISAILRELNQAGLKMQTVNDLLTMYVGAARPSCLSRKPSALTKRLWPTGLSLQAEKSLHHYSTFHCVWADSGWVQRYIDTLRHHGRPGTPSSPPYRRPLELRTSTLCSHPHPSYEANSTNYKSCYQNKWTPLHFFSNHWELPSVQTVPKKHWSTRYNKRHINSFFLASQRTTSREPSLSPKQPKTQVHTYSSPTAKLTRQTTGASESHLPDDSCYPTQPLTTQLTFQPHAPMPVLPTA